MQNLDDESFNSIAYIYRSVLRQADIEDEKKYLEELSTLHQKRKELESNNAAKPEKPNAKPRKVKRKTYKKPAYRRVLAWEKIAPQIEHDPSLKNNMHNLREWLLRNADEDISKLKEDTLREIIKQGGEGKIPSREEFERVNHM